MIGRAALLTACLLATSAYLASAAKAEPTPIRQPLSQLPFVVGTWQGRAEQEFSKEILAVLRVDDYTIRSYARQAAGVGLYVGYHATQRQGASIHSPLNCLPGSGWIPVEQRHLTLTVRMSPDGPSRAVEVNRVVIEKGVDRQLVLYWYQSHGRVVASEYWGKIYSVVDAIRSNRTDAALVRVIAPIRGGDGSVKKAEDDAADFARTLFPLLSDYLPL